MPRPARTVIPLVPHHVTQRGNRREPVFFCDGDCLSYLAWLDEYSHRHGTAILAYCLMPNHVHLIVVPAHAHSLQRTFKPLHMRFAQRVNRMHGWIGHLWQGRFHSEPLTEGHLWNAVRYVELNPVRAGLVERAEDFVWSSAQGHCGIRPDGLLASGSPWKSAWESVGDWGQWLAAGLAGDASLVG